MNFRRQRKCVLTYTTGIGLAGTTLLCSGDSGLTLELPSFLVAGALDERATAQSNMLFVDPSVGEQTIGNGSKNAPFKTITQALQVAQPNSAIVLSPGTYSTSSGETFPLKLKPSVSIQGDPSTRGRNIVIQGGGSFLSPTFAGQNITILGANRASLTGVTVTNPNPRGYGLWIESSSPVVSDNTFTRSNHDGISVTGNSAPTIRNNYFYQNGANGITIYGTSQPEVRENVFEKTGFGINIAQKASPLLIGNRVTQNVDGIVAQANARPVLRGNEIEGNTRDGVVAIAQAIPDLGTATEPGKNVFRQNGRYDVNNSAVRQIIPAFGNQLANDHTNGRVDVAGRVSLDAMYANQSASSRQLTRNSQIVSTNNGAAVANPQSETIPTNNGGSDPAAIDKAPVTIPVPPPASIPQESPPQLSLRQSSWPSPLSRRRQKLSFIPLNSPTLNRSEDRLGNDDNKQPDATSPPNAAIEIPVPPATSQPVLPPPPQPRSTASKLPMLQPAPMSESDLLPVPGGSIPIGDHRTLPKVQSSQNAHVTAAGTPPMPPTLATALGLRYRVVVEAASESTQAEVRSLVPGAFRILSHGQVLMQAGAFSDRAKASELLQLLNSKGLKAAIEQLN